jgi:hypothetical protein
MDVPTFLCLETSSVLRYLLMKRKRFHVNGIYVSREEFGEYYTLLEQADKWYEYFRMKKETIAISAHSFRATSLLWYCLSCTSHKLFLSWTKLIHVSQSIMIYVVIGRKKQTELNSTGLRPTLVVIGQQGRLYWDQARVFQLVWKDWASSADVGRRPYRPMSAPLWPRP